MNNPTPDQVAAATPITTTLLADQEVLAPDPWGPAEVASQPVKKKAKKVNVDTEPKELTEEEQHQLRDKITKFSKFSRESLDEFNSHHANRLEPPRLRFYSPTFEKSSGEDYDENSNPSEHKAIRVNDLDFGALTIKATSLTSSVVSEGMNNARRNMLMNGQLREGVGAMHAPVIDFDIPISVVPSSQLGHYHLYIDKAISWSSYKRILNALASAGLVEPSYVEHSIRKGFSAVRSIGAVKPSQPKKITDVLVENARLRSNYETTQRVLNHQTEQMAPLQKENAQLKNNILRDKIVAEGQKKTIEALEEQVKSLKNTVNDLKKNTTQSSSVPMTWD